MPTESMLSRFKGEDGQRRLGELVQQQLLSGGDRTVAAELSSAAQLLEISAGEVLIRQDAADNDLYLVLAGRLRIVVNGRDVATRGPGEHVGEMAIVDPASPRSATVIAGEQSLVARISEADFVRIASTRPELWKVIARQLCRRLGERKRFHLEPNLKPAVFIGSAKERLPIAEAVAAAIPSKIANVALWSTAVFSASHFVMDDLDAQLRVSDFAVLVAGPDDHVTSRGEVSDAPRDNVVFELGLCMGALSRFRTFLLVPNGQKLKIPSDLLGLTLIKFDAEATDPAAAVTSAVEELIRQIEKQGPK